jgi:hypothetical protein
MAQAIFVGADRATADRLRHRAAPAGDGSRSRRRWLVGLALVVMLVSVGLTLGPLTPIFDVVRRLPALSWFRPKALALPMAHVAVALLAGLGVETLLGTGTGRATTGRRVLVAVMIAAIAELATPVRRAHTRSTRVPMRMLDTMRRRSRRRRRWPGPAASGSPADPRSLASRPNSRRATACGRSTTTSR